MFEEPQFLVPALFVFGAIMGSFGNVMIYRMPREESVVFPASHCQNCKTPIAWYNNVPIFAWFWLRGKCSNCQAPYSFRYPFVELLMATLFAIAGYTLGWSWTLLEALIFTFSVTVASFIDLDHMILPDKLTLSGIAIGLTGAALNPEREFVPALVGAVFGFGFLWLIGYLYIVFRNRQGMGGGDIKLIGWIGAVLGWKAIPFVILVSSIIGSFVGVAVAFRTKGGMSQEIPFGPFLAGAALLYLYIDGARLAEWYLALHGL